jgi:formate hydrogenlyase subunit 3/multisubunit Na+/H+ antiporter MnhD subunit
MPFLLASLGVLLLGGLLAFTWPGHGPGCGRVAAGSVFAAAVLGIIPAVRVLAGGEVVALDLPWEMPLGSFSIGLDGLSAFFVIPILLLAAIAALYGAASLRDSGSRRTVATSWLLYNLLIAGMLLVVVARNGMLLLLSWELMSVASFFLVMFEDGKPEVRRAGWIYLVAAHIGTAGLLVMFVLLGRGSDTLDFNTFRIAEGGPSLPGIIFLLAIVGFGTKAGFVPLHGWLPEAHPAAPSHVSAVMSGVMIKTGIYGLLRVLTFLGPPPPWFGWVLVGIGAVSGVYGVLFALAQHDLKRLLAYHSVENIGIIALGIGVGLLGRSHHLPVVAVLGFGGALLHVFNHALFKGLLFLAAGAVAHAAHTREIDRLGGLLRRLPVTGASFLVGSVAICGLPPLNGFVSEAMVYLAAFSAAISASGSFAVAGIVVIASLALIGGLAAACFTKAFGIVFLGEPRSAAAADAREVAPAMRVAMVILAASCVVVGLCVPFLPGAAAEAIRVVSGATSSEVQASVTWVAGALRFVLLGAGSLLLAFLGISLFRRKLLARRRVASAPTWDCGYAAPTTRMQYTASSYAQPLTSLFGFSLWTRRDTTEPTGLFPRMAHLHTTTPDPVQDGIYAPLFRAVGRFLLRFRWLQGGMIQLYVLYIALTLLILLAWKLG